MIPYGNAAIYDTEHDAPDRPDILILGIGNILLSDEGAGVRVVEALYDRYELPERVEIVDGGTVGVELLPFIEGRTHIIIVDAVNSGNPPGTVIRVDDVPAFFKNKITPHQIGITDVLAMAAITGGLPREVVLIGVEPESLTNGIELSDTVAGTIDRMVQDVVEELFRIGVGMTLKQV